MMKLGRSCLSRLHCSEKLLPGKPGGFGDASGITTVAHEPFGSGSSAARIFAPYTIFKGKAALSVQPVLPTFSKLDSGDFRLERRGVMLFTFWPSIGDRKYDWDRRQHFGVSPTEVGSLLTMTQHNSTEFFHDPGMKSSNSGQVRKSLSVKAHEDGTGYFFSLSVQNSVRNTTDRLNIPVTAAEFAVLKTACSFALPHLMGWDRLTGKSMNRTDLNPPKVGGQLELEWDK